MNKLGRWFKQIQTGLLYGFRQGRDMGPGFIDSFKKRKAPTILELIDQYKGIAYACANLNARAVAAVPSKLFAIRRTGDPELKVAHKRVESHVKQWMRKYKALSGKLADDVVEITEHPILDMLEDANEELDGFGLAELTTLYQEVTGVAYWYVDNIPVMDDEEGETMTLPSSIWLIPTQMLWPNRSDKGILSYKFLHGDDIAAADVIAFKYPSLRDPYGGGRPPLTACIESQDLANSDIAWANTLMENQARPDIIATPKEGGMSRINARRLRRSLREQFAKGGSGGVLVLDDDVDITTLSYNSKQLELLARRGVAKVDIANAYDVPLPLLEAKEINRATLEGALYQHAKLAIVPRLTRYYQRLNAKFIPRFDDRLFLWFDNPVPEDIEAAANQDKVYLDSAVKTINDVRATLGLEDVAWGDEPMISTTIAPLSAVRAQASAGTEAADPATPAGGAQSDTVDPKAEAAEQASQTQDIQTAEANVLNGSQLASALAIITAAAAGDIPRDSAEGLLTVLFNLSPEQVAEVLGSAGDGSDTTPNKVEGADEMAAQIVAGNGPPPPGQPGSPPPKPGVPNPPSAKPPANSGQSPPAKPAKAIAIVAALTSLEAATITRSAAIAKMVAGGVAYESAYKWTAPRLPHIDPPVHREKAKGARGLDVGAKGIAGVLRSIFKRQHHKVLGHLLKTIETVDTKAWYDDLGSVDLSDWDDEMQRDCRPFIQLGFDHGGKDFYARNKVAANDDHWKVTQPKVQKAIDEHTFKFCKATNKTTSMKLKDALNKLKTDIHAAVTSEDDNTPQKLTAIVSAIFDEAETSRAERIALTESSRAVHGGQKAAARESGIVRGFKWLLSDNACPLCQDIAADNKDGIDIDGSFATVSDDPDYGDVPYPPAHPYCQCTMTEIIDEDALKDDSDNSDDSGDDAEE